MLDAFMIPESSESELPVIQRRRNVSVLSTASTNEGLEGFAELILSSPPEPPSDRWHTIGAFCDRERNNSSLSAFSACSYTSYESTSSSASLDNEGSAAEHYNLPDTPMSNVSYSSPPSLVTIPISPKSGKVDRRRRVVSIVPGDVTSSITSRRMKKAEVYLCPNTPPRTLRAKGAIYMVGGDRRKWDGRQWRRVCAVQSCCSAARGTTEFCIAHGRDDYLAALTTEIEIKTAEVKAAMGVTGESSTVRRGSSSSHLHRRFSEDFVDSPSSFRFEVSGADGATCRVSHFELSDSATHEDP